MMAPIGVGRRGGANLRALLCGSTALAVVPLSAFAGSARDYLNTPIDSWFAFYNFGYSASVTPEGGLDVTPGVRSSVVSQSVVLTRTMDFWGRTGGISVVLPYVHVDASSGTFSGSNQGFSDLGFLWQMNIFGGPALTKQEFRSFVPQTFASFHLFVNVPTGKYDPANPLNPSANRWTISPTVNYSYTPDRGRTWLEAYLSARVFTANDAYQVGGASRLTQQPLFLAEGHASRNLTRTLWVSADAYYNAGGATSIDGVGQHNAANTLRLGAGLGLSVWSGADVILNYEGVVAKPADEPYAQAVRVTLRQFW